MFPTLATVAFVPATPLNWIAVPVVDVIAEPNWLLLILPPPNRIVVTSLIMLEPFWLRASPAPRSMALTPDVLMLAPLLTFMLTLSAPPEIPVVSAPPVVVHRTVAPFAGV